MNGSNEEYRYYRTYLASNVVWKPVQSFIKPFSWSGTCALDIPAKHQQKLRACLYLCRAIKVWRDSSQEKRRYEEQEKFASKFVFLGKKNAFCRWKEWRAEPHEVSHHELRMSMLGALSMNLCFSCFVGLCMGVSGSERECYQLYQWRCLREWRPSLSVISAAFIAFGRSCLFANTRSTASLSSSCPEKNKINTISSILIRHCIYRFMQNYHLIIPVA